MKWMAMEHRPVEPVTEKPPFKAIGGWLCLDFVNSVNWDSDNREAERFFEYVDLVRWAQFAGTLTEREAKLLKQVARQRPLIAAKTYRWALDLRAALHRIFSAVATGQSPEAADMAALNRALTPALARSKLAPAADGFSWVWAGGEGALERVLWPVLRSAADLLTSEKLARLGQCAGDSCGWLFVDTSRNHSRRWCEMAHCGNRAKARRHYRRQQAEEG
jgi:predicted RNA-binding Zn ribbon-like protein